MKNLLLQILKNWISNAKRWVFILKTWIAIAKKWAFILLLIGFVAMPEDLLHYLAVLVHKLYEGGALLLEEILGHTLGVSKYYSQLIVFYLSLGAGLLGLYWLWRRLPALVLRIKNRLSEQYALIRIQAVQAWQRLPLDQKIKLLLFQLASMIGAYFLLIA